MSVGSWTKAVRVHTFGGTDEKMIKKAKVGHGQCTERDAVQTFFPRPGVIVPLAMTRYILSSTTL